MEAKLSKLLSPLEKDEQSLMKLDAIFAVSNDAVSMVTSTSLWA